MPDPGERYLSNGRGGGTIAITSGWIEIAAGVSTRPRVNFIPWNLLFFFRLAFFSVHFFVWDSIPRLGHHSLLLLTVLSCPLANYEAVYSSLAACPFLLCICFGSCRLPSSSSSILVQRCQLECQQQRCFVCFPYHSIQYHRAFAFVHFEVGKPDGCSSFLHSCQCHFCCV